MAIHPSNPRTDIGLRRTLFLSLKESGKIIRSGFGTSFKIRKKGPINLVTEIDMRAENKIVTMIKRNFPSHRILTEESKPYGGDSPFRWIVDPLDGTTNFAHGIPLCCVSIGLEYEGEIILGGVYNSLLGELFFAEKGKGSFLNGKRIQVSVTKKLNDSLIVTGFPYDRQEKAEYYLKYFKKALEHTQGIRRLGAAALDLAYVACGRFDAFWEFSLKPWDIAAGALIVREAGGTVSDFKGNPLKIDQPFELLASNKIIHPKLREIMREA